jgi:hypothetical protein
MPLAHRIAMAWTNRPVPLACVAATCLLAAGCITPEGLARTRAANEFNCPEEQVVLTERQELSAGTFDVNACGHVARYTCLTNARGTSGCAREPYP